MKSKLMPKSPPMRIIVLTCLYLVTCIGTLSYMLSEYMKMGCSWRRIVFISGAMIVCAAACWLFLCGEKIACAFMLGVSLYGAIYCISLLLSGQSFLFSFAELAFLALGTYTFFSGKYFVGDGINCASTVQSMAIITAGGICMIPVCSFLLTGNSPFEAAASLVCAVLYCMHTKLGKYCVMIYMLMAIFVYGASFYFLKYIFYLLLALCYLCVLVITYRQRDYLTISLKSKSHK